MNNPSSESISPRIPKNEALDPDHPKKMRQRVTYPGCRIRYEFADPDDLDALDVPWYADPDVLYEAQHGDPHDF